MLRLKHAAFGAFALAVLPLPVQAQDFDPSTLSDASNMEMSARVIVRGPQTNNEVTYTTPVNSVFGCYEHTRATIENIVEGSNHSNVSALCLAGDGRVMAAFRCRNSNRITCTKTR